MSKDTQPVAFSANAPHNAAFIVYMNGIEVPVKSVTMRYGVWQIPEMQIEMVADPILTRMGAEDRIQVVVFDLDDTAPDPSVKPEFRLFGEGEVTGWGYQNTTGGRSITFTVVNQIAIFTQLFVQFITNVDDMLAYETFGGAGATTPSNYTSELIFPYSLFKKGLLVPVGKNAPSKNAAGQDPDSINRPFDFLYNLIRCLMGPVPADQRAVPAANFFTRWARLTNIVNRFVGSPVFDEPNILEANPNINIFPILKALQTTSAVDVITKNLIPQVQNSGSFYDMLKLVYQTVFMELAMIPGMPLVTVDLASSIVLPTDFTKHTLVSSSEIDGFVEPAQAPNPLKPDRIQNYFPKPQFLFGLPPSCNVFFPSQVTMLQYGENYATQPTRLYFNDEVIPKALSQQNDGLGDAMMNALSMAYPPEADAANKSRAINPKSTGKNFLLFPEEFYKGPVMDRRTVPTWLYFLRQNEETKKKDPKQVQTPEAGTDAQENLYEKLKIGSPDVYKLYIEYEFFRERFSRRTGSVTMTWNPYVVPGFPMAVFDNRATRVDLFAYVTTVQQHMTHRSRSTTVSFSYGRTIQEMFDLMSNDFADGAPAYGVGPLEPVREIRQAIQSFDRAELYYQKLFYGNQKLYNKDASFDWRKVIAYAPLVAGQEPTPIFIDGGDEAKLADFAAAGEVLPTFQKGLDAAKLKFAELSIQKIAVDATIAKFLASIMTIDILALKQSQEEAARLQQQIKIVETAIAALQTKVSAAAAIVNDTTLQTQSEVIHNLVGDRELVPTQDGQKYFESYDEATRFNWRPRCTLDEYIIFHNSFGEGEIPAFKHPQSVGVRYFERIRQFTALTADTVLPAGADGLNADVKPNPEAANQSAPQPVTGTTTTPASTVSVVPGLPRSFPQTRADWDSLLVAYRNNVYHTKVPRT